MLDIHVNTLLYDKQLPNCYQFVHIEVDYISLNDFMRLITWSSQIKSIVIKSHIRWFDTFIKYAYPSNQNIVIELFQSEITSKQMRYLHQYMPDISIFQRYCKCVTSVEVCDDEIYCEVCGSDDVIVPITCDYCNFGRICKSCTSMCSVCDDILLL
jgi:hypothetical protein